MSKYIFITDRHRSSFHVLAEIQPISEIDIFDRSGNKCLVIYSIDRLFIRSTFQLYLQFVIIIWLIVDSAAVYSIHQIDDFIVFDRSF